MSHRRPPAVLAAALLALAACSGSPEGQEPPTGPGTTAVSAATATTAPPVGTVDPPAQVVGLGGLGLSKATMSVQVEPGLVNYDDQGLTYVEPRTSSTADLVVRNVRWDGTPGWDATVPLPQEGGPYTPVMSYDDAAGVVSLWFTTQTPDPTAPATNRAAHHLAGPVHWFDTATGQGQAVTVPVSGDQTTSSHPALVGARILDASGGFTGEAVLDLGRSLSTAQATDLFPGGEVATVVRDLSWHGSYLAVTAPTSGEETLTLYVGASPVLTTGKDSSLWPVPDRVLVLLPSESRLVSVTEAGAQDMDLQGCPVSFSNTVRGGSANGYSFVGQLLVAPDGSTRCLASQVGQTGEQIDGVLSDGSVLLRSPADASGRTTSRIVDASGTTRTQTTSVSPFDTHGAHLVFTTTDAAGAVTVTAFSEKDLALSQ